MTTNADMITTLNRAVAIYNKIKVLEKGELQELKDSLEHLKLKLQREMVELNIKTLESDKGYVKFVEREGVEKFDEEMLKQVLGSDLSEFKKRGKGTTYLKFGVTEENEQN